MSPGDTVLVLDGAGWEYVTTIERLGREEAIGRIEVRRQATGEPRPRVVLYQALLRREKFEIVLQKATEVGVAGFVPVRTARSLIPRAEQVDARRQERWRRIVREAAEQSGRGLLPEVHAAVDFAAAVRSAVADGPTILLFEGQGCLALRQALRQMPPVVDSIALFVGPEGGFADEEVVLAVERGIALVGLGPRILRSETAGIVGPALLLYELGAMEPCDGASPS
jgi:16S rRNA (uracil1498-N3)-methyltransferase